MTPDEIESFAFGFDLTSAAYSGGAGGTFANLVAGGEDWVVNGATPSFETRGSLEGMLFANSATESILGQFRAMREATIIAVAAPDSAGTGYVIGGNYATNNSFAIMTNAYRAQAYRINGSSGYTASSTVGTPNVLAVSFSPDNGTSYAQMNASSPVSTVFSPGSLVSVNWPDAAIGRMRTYYFTGWIARVLVFSRALHYRDNTSLQALITSEIARL